MAAALPGRVLPPPRVRNPVHDAFDPHRSVSEGSFLIRPWSRVATSGGQTSEVMISHILDARTWLGIMLTVGVQELSGAGAQLEIRVQRSLDKVHWVNIQGLVTLTAPRTIEIERHLLGPWLRTHLTLVGTNASCLLRVAGEWLDSPRYAANTSVSWNNPPLTAGVNETFALTGVVPGLTLTWNAVYQNQIGETVGQDSGSGTTDIDGAFTGSSTVTAGTGDGAATVTVSVAGDSPVDTATITAT